MYVCLYINIFHLHFLIIMFYPPDKFNYYYKIEGTNLDVGGEFHLGGGEHAHVAPAVGDGQSGLVVHHDGVQLDLGQRASVHALLVLQLLPRRCIAQKRKAFREKHSHVIHGVKSGLP